MAARTKSKVTPKYKTKYRVTNWPAYEEGRAAHCTCRHRPCRRSRRRCCTGRCSCPCRRRLQAARGSLVAVLGMVGSPGRLKIRSGGLDAELGWQVRDAGRENLLVPPPQPTVCKPLMSVPDGTRSASCHGGTTAHPRQSRGARRRRRSLQGSDLPSLGTARTGTEARLAWDTGPLLLLARGGRQGDRDDGGNESDQSFDGFTHTHLTAVRSSHNSL